MKTYDIVDTVAIEVKFFYKYEKAPITLKLAQPMRREDASNIADIIKQDRTVFMVTCITDKGMIF